MTDEPEGKGTDRVHLGNGELPLIFAAGLEALGLDIRLVSYSGDGDGNADEEDVEEIVVTNPAAPERGEIRLGDDGSVTWECWGKLDGEAGISKILGTITSLLTGTG